MDWQNMPLRVDLKDFQGYLETCLLHVLAQYHWMLQSMMGQSPAMLLMCRQSRSCLILGTHVTTKVNEAKILADRKRYQRMLHIGYSVNCKFSRKTQMDIRGVSEKQIWLLTFRVRLEDGQVRKRHIDHTTNERTNRTLGRWPGEN